VANDTTGLFHTIVAATSQAAAHLQYRNAFLDAIYWDYQPIVAIPYSTLTVVIPTVSEGDVTDIGNGPINPTDTRNSTASIVLDKHFSTSFVIKSWEQIRTPVQLRDKYIAPRLEAFKRKMNRGIAELVNTTNFATYTLISGSGADVFDRADIAGAWANLAGAGVPVDDSGNMSLITNVTAYSKMLAATTFNQESIVGVSEAEAVQRRAVIEQQYGARVYWDQHIGVYNSGKQPGILMHRYAMAGVTADPASNPDIDETTIMVGKVPLQVQMEYSLKDQGHIVHMHAYWGIKVVRADFGSLIETA